jgi:hypothetical protein
MRPLVASFFIVVMLAGVSAAPIPVAHAFWSYDGLLVASGGLNSQPNIIADGVGGSIISWHGGANTDIFAQHLTSQGQVAPGWPTDGPLIVCSVTGLQEHPVVVSDYAEGALFFWQDARSGTNYDIYAQHVTSSGGLETDWPEGGRVISAAAYNQYAPAAASDGQDGAIVVWYDSRNDFGKYYDIYAQHVTGDGVLGWPPAGLQVCGAANSQVDPAVIADGVGGAFIAWLDYRKGTESDIYIQHVASDGSLVHGWPENGLGVCTAPNCQFCPVLASDGAGGVFVAWQDYRSGTDNHIYAQHLASDGSLVNGWPEGGRPVCQAPNSQYCPAIASCSPGEAIIVWQDYRSGIDNNIYAQHVTSSGGLATNWPEDGRSISSAVNGQFLPRVTPDASGGAFIAWHDSRNGSSNDIYVQQVSGSGNLDALWPDDFPACLAPNSQQFPVIVGSGVGGAIVAWQDQRTGEVAANAIYAQHTQTDDLLGVESPRGLVSRMAPGRPNPFRSSIQIRLALVEPVLVKAEVFDLAGRRVQTLASGVYAAGDHTLVWDGTTVRSGPAWPGVYFVRVRWPGFEKTQRIVRLR